MPYDQSLQSRNEADAELARHLLDGSESAFNEFVSAYRGKLFQYSYLICGQKEDAEEAAQETFMRVSRVSISFEILSG